MRKITLDEETVKTLREIMQLTGSDSYADTINEALTLFEWACEQKEKGNTIVFINEILGTIVEFDTDAIIPRTPTHPKEEM